MLTFNKKILFILHVPPPIHGASMVGSYIQESKLINENFKTRYISLGTTKNFKERKKTSITKIFRYFKLLHTSLHTIFTFKPDLIYISLTAQGIGFYKDALVVLLAKILDGKMLYHFHNKGVKTRQHNPFDNWLYKKVFKDADVVLLSEYLYTDIEKYISREHVHVCPNGIPDQISIVNKQLVKRTNKPVKLLFLSNLIESKGVYVLIEACDILKQKGLSFTCVLVGGVGDITTHQLNKKISESNLEKEVMYLGKKYGLEKESAFAASDIFVFPTYYPNECFPLVLLEAMQSKLPIISTPEGGISSIVNNGKNGYLVPQKDLKTLANRLEELIRNPKKRKEMGENGRKKYEQEFKIDQFEKRITNILEEVMYKNE